MGDTVHLEGKTTLSPLKSTTLFHKNRSIHVAVHISRTL